jgi:hypothetical protein
MIRNSEEQLPMDQRLVLWTKEQALAFGHRPVKAKHRLPELELFTDASLVALLEDHPREALQVFTMGKDLSCRSDWQPVDTAGASGNDLLRAVCQGRLWFNIHHVQQFHLGYRDITKQLFAELRDLCPSFEPLNYDVTLIISSPEALVYYHADAQPNLLWHVRGQKRLWVYPANQSRFIEQEVMEDIFASVADEEAAYIPDFDNEATRFDVSPGDVLCWPQNAPHRVTNLAGLNVSLSTVFQTENSERRKLTYCANRLFRRTYGIPLWSTKEIGMTACLKRIAFRAFRRLGLVHTPPRRAYVAKLHVDPEVPEGCAPLSGEPVLTEFSKKDFTLGKDASGRVLVGQKTAN